MGKLKANPFALIMIGAAFLVVVFLLPACSIKHQAKGVYHRVKSGETLYMIARSYNTEIQELAEANNIEDPNRIAAGSVIFIPDAQQVIEDVIASIDPRRPATVIRTPKAEQAIVSKQQRADMPKTGKPATDSAASAQIKTPPGDVSTIRIKPPKIMERRVEGSVETQAAGSPPKEKGPLPRQTTGATEAKEETIKKTPPYQPDPPTQIARTREPAQTDEQQQGTDGIRFDRKRFIWPAKGKVVSRFGIQPSGMYFNGITIAAADNTTVAAAAKGTIIFSGQLKDYGETVIIMHEDHYATVYTHLGQRKVKLDDNVRQADIIGQVGKGDEKTPGGRLGFEIRYKNKARNPMFFLP